MSVLGEDLARLEEWLGARVLPLLDGEDTAVLGLYYSLLGPAHQHRVAALTIMEEAAINIDFKLLQQGDEEVLQAITSANVETVAKVLDVLGNVEMTSSIIYKYWAFETFLRHLDTFRDILGVVVDMSQTDSKCLKMFLCLALLRHIDVQ